jgi:hypothetical protein
MLNFHLGQACTATAKVGTESISSQGRLMHQQCLTINEVSLLQLHGQAGAMAAVIFRCVLGCINPMSHVSLYGLFMAAACTMQPWQLQ